MLYLAIVTDASYETAGLTVSVVVPPPAVIRVNGDSILFRASAYIAAAFVVYLEAQQPEMISSVMTTAENFYFALLAVTIGLAVRFAAGVHFKSNPLDYLLIFIVVTVGILSHNQTQHAELGAIVAKLVILFYGCELILSHAKSRWNTLNLSTLGTMLILSTRSLL